MSILIVFGSLLGKTKRLAVLVGTQLKAAGFDVKVKDVRDTNINELDYQDLVILACSTWDDGMLQFDFREFHQKLMRTKFPNKKFAVLGVGGHRYPHFCTSADILSSAVKMSGGTLIQETLKLDLDHDEAIDKCDVQVLEWTSNLIQQCNNVSAQ